MNHRSNKTAYSTSINPVRLGVAALLAVVGVSFASASFATTESVEAEVEFVSPITITENNALQYGLIDVNFANTDTVVIAPNSGLTDTNSKVLGGTQAAADLTVGATAVKAATILIDTIVAGSGYTLGTFMCKYNGGTDTACDSAMTITTAATAELLVGASITGDGNAVDGTANGSFVVNVTYD